MNQEDITIVTLLRSGNEWDRERAQAMIQSQRIREGLKKRERTAKVFSLLFPKGMDQ